MADTVSPSLLASLLDMHAIGADAPGGSGLIEDRSIDRDWSEVRIDGTYDLLAVALDLETFVPDEPEPEPVPEPERSALPYPWIIGALIVLLIVSHLLR